MSSKGKRKKRTTKAATSKSPAKRMTAQVQKALKLNQRIALMEQQQEASHQIKREEAKFLTNLMLSMNALADLLVTKGIVTEQELGQARQKAAMEFADERRKDELIEKGELCICRCEGDAVCPCPCHKAEPCDHPHCKFCEPFREAMKEEEKKDPPTAKAIMDEAAESMEPLPQTSEPESVYKCECGEELEDMDGQLICPVCLEVPDELGESEERAEELGGDT